MNRQPNLEFLRRAIALATENVTSGRGGPFAALIARDGKVIAEGVNMVTATNDPTAHGEVTAIRAACKALGTFSLAGCELYTELRAVPHVPGGIALGAARMRFSMGLERKTQPRQASTTPSFIENFARSSGAVVAGGAVSA